MSSEPPKRNSSLEMTAVRPRESIAPASTVGRPSIEMLADLERARRDAEEDRETLMECPLCREGMVTPEQHSAWLAKYPELAIDEAPASQPDLETA